jgi:hypothetical protein
VGTLTAPNSISDSRGVIGLHDLKFEVATACAAVPVPPAGPHTPALPDYHIRVDCSDGIFCNVSPSQL